MLSWLLPSRQSIVSQASFLKKVSTFVFSIFSVLIFPRSCTSTSVLSWRRLYRFCHNFRLPSSLASFSKHYSIQLRSVLSTMQCGPRHSKASESHRIVIFSYFHPMVRLHQRLAGGGHWWSLFYDSTSGFLELAIALAQAAFDFFLQHRFLADSISILMMCFLHVRIIGISNTFF